MSEIENGEDTFVKHTAKNTVYRNEGINVEWQIDFGRNTGGSQSREIAVRIAVCKRSTQPFPSFFVPAGERNPRKLKIPAFSNGLKRLRRAEGTDRGRLAPWALSWTRFHLQKLHQRDCGITL